MRLSHIRLLTFLAASFACAFAGAGEACNLRPGEALLPREIVDGQSLILADGREAVLAGVEVPPPGEGRGQYAQEAQGLLADLLRDGARIAYDKTREDRYGRLQVFPLLGDGQTAQARLVAAGLARVMSTPDNRTCIGELLVLEAEARAARRGLWSDPFFAVVDAGDLAGLHRAEGRFVIVEGVVADAASVRGRLYVNFGADRRRDFTVTVAPAAAKLFKAGVWPSILGHPTTLVGRVTRVRGFLESFNGPEITVTHPEQIEFPEHGKEAANSGGRTRRSSD
ncbi:thermonuclease family protein [Parvibaculum sedimenti]|uniref:Thermonuclease family protein n=2 Tax=Parvibaculum sedimenti TaxID=2608632 RepID=A0A6N6VGC1_9HYPH|nr:thermonuclease family protein [Parvibaculum sedimenti]KAB7738732.1 thermonuclease family protein [Parvibaculum sedimenti]